MERSIRILSQGVVDQTLISLAKAKLALKIDANDTTRDAVLMSFIERASAEIAALANRSFGEERVEETFRNIAAPRQYIYLSRWPVKSVERVMEADVQIYDWDVEFQTGQLMRRARAYWSSPIVVTYTGGYNLPENSPMALQQAAILLGQELFWDYQQGGQAAVRMVSHKESRVMYYDPNSSTSSGSGSASAQTQRAVQNLINRYIRFEV